MRVFILVIFLLITSFTQAQEFAPAGAEWYYFNESGGFPPLPNVLWHTSTKDSVILGQKTKEIKQFRYFQKSTGEAYIDSSGSYYFYQDEDSVFVYDPFEQDFDKQFIFNVSKGDTITLDVSFEVFHNYQNLSTFRFRIDSVVIETYGTLTLKKYKTSALDEINYRGGWYYDMIGGLGWLLPRSEAQIPEETGPLMCYKYNGEAISFYHYQCEDIITGLATVLEDQISIFPNPVRDRLQIETALELTKIELYNSHGVKLDTFFTKEVNLSNLPQGVYMLKIFSGNANTVKRIFKL